MKDRLGNIYQVEHVNGTVELWQLVALATEGANESDQAFIDYHAEKKLDNNKHKGYN